ncbi:hypothetical protein JCM16496A_40360 [Bacteroides rodentium JCM 16496]
MCIFGKIALKERIIVIANISRFRFFKYEKSVIKHKVAHLINRLIDLQGFFNKIVVRFSFINIFALC